MKNLSFLIHLAVLLLSGQSFAQTKLISYKSHSGNMEYFEKSIVEDSYNTNYSNLGIRPEPYIINPKLDSVIIIDDKKSVIVTSVLHKDRRNSNTEKWNTGRDTVYNHPIFSSQNIDSVKNVLRRNYNFENDLDSTVFLKYDKETKQYKPIPSKKTVKTAEINNTKSKVDMLYYLVISIAALAFVVVYRKSR
ncbi:hypothetical protein JI747_014275 [Chryseobacterium sp. RG1]|uniref:Uncharacterized protein n=1 Tax=Chryseobacterium tagetis TaxID=2801334 RepID=A0ABS8A618_9FLAO|nr:hypothetical protein [Chryseobacterium tagetis]MCA6068355.1 hypothetical protein [Chryseobacterium tagetis]